MTRGIVCGHATCTVAHPSLQGQKILLVQMLGAENQAQGVPVLVVDPLGAGVGSEVLVTTDGRGAQQLVDDPNSPIRNSVLAIVDKSCLGEEGVVKRGAGREGSVRRNLDQSSANYSSSTKEDKA